MVATIAGMVRKTLSAGAMFASVLDVVSNSPNEFAGKPNDSPWSSESVDDTVVPPSVVRFGAIFCDGYSSPCTTWPPATVSSTVV